MWPYHQDLLTRPVPRYTSFPTAAEFGETVGEAEQAGALAGAEGPVSLYVHIPFCERICWYCGCNTAAAGRARRLEAYMAALHAEIALVARMLPAGARVTRIAFGGGSPNALSPIAFVRLLDRLVTAFRATGPVISVEIDPRGFGDEWAATLGAAGVRRASLGVQTFAPAVQAAIGRVQCGAMIERAVAAMREAGVNSINFDLMYGLPHQDEAVLDETLERAVALAPERIALFGYAHVPHLLPRQRRIDADALPGARGRFAMAARGHDRLVAAGYVPVGFDHFALPGDPLARAAASGLLRRNFQGFTDDDAETLIGLGASAISLFPDRIVQNAKHAGQYGARLSEGRLAGERGVWRSREDRERAMVIEDILCGRAADLSALPGEARAPAGLAPFVARGLVGRSGDGLAPTEATRPYARSIAALFDPYRAASPHAGRAGEEAPRRFSNAI